MDKVHKDMIAAAALKVSAKKHENAGDLQTHKLASCKRVVAKAAADDDSGSEVDLLTASSAPLIIGAVRAGTKRPAADDDTDDSETCVTVPKQGRTTGSEAGDAKVSRRGVGAAGAASGSGCRGGSVRHVKKTMEEVHRSKKMKVIQYTESVLFEVDQVFEILSCSEGAKSLQADKMRSLHARVQKRMTNEVMEWYFYDDDDLDEEGGRPNGSAADGADRSGMKILSRLNTAAEKLQAAEKVLAALPGTNRSGQPVQPLDLEEARQEADNCNLALPSTVRATCLTRVIS